MIKDKTIDEALLEIMRTKRALEALRAERKRSDKRLGYPGGGWRGRDQAKEHAAALRASLDLTHKLADLRQGR